MNDAINKAGRQRMLSQRMAKAWLATGQGWMRSGPKNHGRLDGLVRSAVGRVEGPCTNSDIRTTYASLESVWGLQDGAGGPCARSRAAADLLALDARVLKLAHQGTVQMEAYSGRSVGRLVNM